MDTEIKEEMTTVIYRYKFDDDFVNDLSRFAKVHQYDTRGDFKDAWNVWIADNDDIISVEINRLKGLHYDGDVLDKMFKSARYYFRKKSDISHVVKQRNAYVCVQKCVLEEMDSHILKNTHKPSFGFIQFCVEQAELVNAEIQRLKDGDDEKKIIMKIKKTYKNRYFIVKNNV
jgi:hypothetical protein